MQALHHVRSVRNQDYQVVNLAGRQARLRERPFVGIPLIPPANILPMSMRVLYHQVQQPHRLEQDRISDPIFKISPSMKILHR